MSFPSLPLSFIWLAASLFLLYDLASNVGHSHANIVPGPGAPARSGSNPCDAATMQLLARSLGADRALGWGKVSPDPCNGSWVGVECNEEGYVTCILANNSGLTGHLPPETHNLSRLYVICNTPIQH